MAALNANPRWQLLLPFIFHLPSTSAIPVAAPNVIDVGQADGSDFAPIWVSEPLMRGTWHILYSCLFTLTLCVYTAIHLNIPKPRETVLEMIWRKTKWVLIAIFAPEAVLYAAYAQWYVAKNTASHLNMQRRGNERLMSTYGVYAAERAGSDGFSVSEGTENKNDEEQKLLQTFSLVYGYYVVMGGIVIDVSDLHDEFSRVTVTPEGLLYLAEKGYFIPVDENAIKDKSKADVFAKVIVIVQVLWMVIQTAGRLFEKLPVTLLEGHTLVHVITALSMYALWFKKPLNICEPTVISSRAFPGDIALMLMRNKGFGRKALNDGKLVRVTLDPNDTSESAYLRNYFAADPETKRVPSDNKQPPEVINLLQRRNTARRGTEREKLNEIVLPHDHKTKSAVANAVSESISEQLRTHSSAYPFHSHSYIITYPNSKVSNVQPFGQISSGQSMYGIGPIIPTVEEAPFYSDSDSIVRSISISLTPKDVNRWHKAAQELQKSQEPLGLTHNLNGNSSSPCYFLSTPVRNLPWIKQQGITSVGKPGWLVFIFFLLCTAYGAVHLLAWNIAFPTLAEERLFKVACIDLTVAGFFYLLLWPYWRATDDSELSERSSLLRGARIAVVVLGAIHFVVYTMARIFIVLEAFLGLRHLPVDAFRVFRWADVIPHF